MANMLVPSTGVLAKYASSVNTRIIHWSNEQLLAYYVITPVVDTRLQIYSEVKNIFYVSTHDIELKVCSH